MTWREKCDVVGKVEKGAGVPSGRLKKGCGKKEKMNSKCRLVVKVTSEYGGKAGLGRTYSHYD